MATDTPKSKPDLKEVVDKVLKERESASKNPKTATQKKVEDITSSLKNPSIKERAAQNIEQNPLEGLKKNLDMRKTSHRIFYAVVEALDKLLNNLKDSKDIKPSDLTTQQQKANSLRSQLSRNPSLATQLQQLERSIAQLQQRLQAVQKKIQEALLRKQIFEGTNVSFANEHLVFNGGSQLPYLQQILQNIPGLRLIQPSPLTFGIPNKLPLDEIIKQLIGGGITLPKQPSLPGKPSRPGLPRKPRNPEQGNEAIVQKEKVRLAQQIGVSPEQIKTALFEKRSWGGGAHGWPHQYQTLAIIENSHVAVFQVEKNGKTEYWETHGPSGFYQVSGPEGFVGGADVINWDPNWPPRDVWYKYGKQNPRKNPNLGENELVPQQIQRNAIEKAAKQLGVPSSEIKVLSSKTVNQNAEKGKRGIVTMEYYYVYHEVVLDVKGTKYKYTEYEKQASKAPKLEKL